jgi:hypothetical protein
VVVILGDVVRSVRIIDESDEPLEWIVLRLVLAFEVEAKRLANVSGLGAAGPRCESLQSPIGVLFEVKLLSPHTPEYTSLFRGGLVEAYALEEEARRLISRPLITLNSRGASRSRPGRRGSLFESIRTLRASPAPARCPARRVLEPRSGVAVLDAEPLDRLRGLDPGLRELLAAALAERRGERVDLPDGRPFPPHVGVGALPLIGVGIGVHGAIQPHRTSRVCAGCAPDV